MAQYELKSLHGPKDFSAALFGGGSLGAIVGLIITGIIAALIAGGIISTGGAALIAPSLFIIVAWGAGFGASGMSFWITFTNLHQKIDNPVGWVALGLGCVGTFATLGAILGTFLPVPGLGTLTGAAAGAVLGTLAGLGMALCAMLTVRLGMVIARCFPTPESTDEQGSLGKNPLSEILTNKKSSSNKDGLGDSLKSTTPEEKKNVVTSSADSRSCAENPYEVVTISDNTHEKTEQPDEPFYNSI